MAGAALLLVLAFVLAFVHPTRSSAPSLRAALETVMTVAALSGATLIRGQFLHTRRLRQLLILSGLILLALTEFFANALPAGLQLPSGPGFTAAVPLGQMMIAVLFALSARSPSDKVVLRSAQPVLLGIGLAVAAFIVAELGGLLLRGQLMLGPSRNDIIDRVHRHPLGFVVLLLTVGLYIWAAGEFARRGRIEQNGVLPLFGLAALLLGLARLYSLSMPLVSANSVSLREGIRLFASGVIFVAALRGHRELRAAVAHAAAAAERRRVAQDLHDGLAQDLAFIAAQGTKLAAELGQEHPVMQAARHALAVSREAIGELSELTSSSSRETLDAIAHELSERFSVGIVVDVAPDVVLDAETQDQVGRITREAIANAVRHGDAQRVFVCLKRTTDAKVLRVIDDGSGVNGGQTSLREGFGFRSMRDRAATLNGVLTVRTGGSRGTELEVVFP
jgi:signal transduction histidine kinase